MAVMPRASAQGPMSGFNPAGLADAANGIPFELKAFCGDNALALKTIFFNGGWDGTFRPLQENNLVLAWETDTGVVYSGWRFAVFYRGELFAATNRDTLEFLRITHRKEKLPVGKTYDLQLSADGFSGKGVELSKGFHLMPLKYGNLSMGITARYIQGERVQDGTIKGRVLSTAPDAYKLDADLDYVYDKNFLYKSENTNPGAGGGYSFDAGFRYDPIGDLSIELLFRDILGRIDWQDVPYTDARLNSSRKVGKGIHPLLSGYESYKDFTQALPLQTDLQATYRYGPFLFNPEINFIENVSPPLYWFDMGYRPTPNLTLDAGYNFNFKAYSLGASYGNARISVYCDNADPSSAAAVGLNLAWKYDF